MVIGVAKIMDEPIKNRSILKCQKPRYVLHREHVGSHFIDQIAKMSKQMPLRVFLFLAVGRERLARCTTDQNAWPAGGIKGIDLMPANRGYVTSDKRSSVVALKCVAAVLVDVHASVNLESVLKKAMGQPASATEKINYGRNWSFGCVVSTTRSVVQ
jgi:hypothetical protein